MDHESIAQILGSYGEFVGAIAVVITLAYLAVQVRQNTLALRASSINSMTQFANDIRTNLFSDPEITAIYMNGLRDVESRNDLERERFRLLMTNALWALWNAYTQAQLGDTQSWDAQKPLLRRFLSLPGGDWFWRTYRNEFSSEFQAEVDLVLHNAGT